MSYNTKSSKNKDKTSANEKTSNPGKGKKKLVSDFPEINLDLADSGKNEKPIPNPVKKQNSQGKGHRLSFQIFTDDIEFSDNNEDECNLCTSKHFPIYPIRNWQGPVLR
jgi:hypothetical protein